MAASKDVSKRKSAMTPAEREAPPVKPGEEAPNPVWFKPVMFGFMLLGLIWLVVFYISSSTLVLPIPALGQNNIFVGFGLILIGFLMTTRWR